MLITLMRYVNKLNNFTEDQIYAKANNNNYNCVGEHKYDNAC